MSEVLHTEQRSDSTFSSESLISVSRTLAPTNSTISILVVMSYNITIEVCLKVTSSPLG